MQAGEIDPSVVAALPEDPARVFATFSLYSHMEPWVLWAAILRPLWRVIWAGHARSSRNGDLVTGLGLILSKVGLV